ncbi:MAG: phosphatidate cytidylyltransferase, partial [Spongiibacter sp.]|nr:phosphatidate cytidylyltransferase [Spongiibacter sp.]
MLKQRVITAVVIVAALLAALMYLTGPQLSLVFAVLVSVAAWEWSDLSGVSSAIGRAVFVGVCVGL